MRNTVLLDIDHVIADASRREHLLQDANLTSKWDAFHADSVNDEPLADMVTVVEALRLHIGLQLLAVTGRPEKWRAITMAWLVKHNVAVDELLMRPDNDFRKAPEVKVDLLVRLFGSEQAVRDNVLAVFDDDERICTAFKGLGLTVFQVYGRTTCNV
jgi:hypothetical protein